MTNYDRLRRFGFTHAQAAALDRAGYGFTVASQTSEADVASGLYLPPAKGPHNHVSVCVGAPASALLPVGAAR